jgi:adenylate kinase
LCKRAPAPGGEVSVERAVRAPRQQQARFHAPSVIPVRSQAGRRPQNGCHPGPEGTFDHWCTFDEASPLERRCGHAGSLDPGSDLGTRLFLSPIRRGANVRRIRLLCGGAQPRLLPARPRAPRSLVNLSQETADDVGTIAPSSLVVLAGPPGAGKGTQCSQLVEQHGMVHISLGDALRQEVEHGTALGSRVRDSIETGRLVPDRDVYGVIADRLTRHRTASAVLLDGFPRTIGQAEMLERLRPGAVGLVVLLVLPMATILRRLCSRGRADDGDPDAVAERMLAYDRDTRPVLAWYASRGLLAHVDANASPRDVTARIEGHLAAFGLCAPPAPPLLLGQ